MGGGGITSIFFGPRATTTPSNAYGRIYGIDLGTASCNLGGLGFQVASCNSGCNGQLADIMRLTSTGVGVFTTTPQYALDVNGIARSAMAISSLCNTSATFASSSYGVNFYITNSAFSLINLVGGTGSGTGGTNPTPLQGWFVTLRNNSGSYLSVDIGGLLNTTPKSPLTIPPQNSVIIAYDTNLDGLGTGGGYVLF